jgi:polysaccharide pyruvyl transferase WcaK-like protein
MDALRRAKAIVLRDSASAASLPNGCVPILASDLLFSLPSQTAPENREKTLIFPNCFVLPVAGQDARYGVAYEWFRLEFNDICRSLVAAGHELHVIPMYVFDGIDDRTATALTLDASIPVIRHEKMHLNEVKEMVASARLAITQRLHGAIFAFLADTPCVCIAHHDKIWSFCSETGSPVMDYYGFSQRAFKSTMCLANEKNPKRLQYIEKARNQWAEISGIVERLSFS